MAFQLVMAKSIQSYSVFETLLISYEMPITSSSVGRAAAAAGQSGVMALYDNLFGLMDLQAAQVLVTSNDFTEDVFKDNLCATVEDLLSMNVVCLAFKAFCLGFSIRHHASLHTLMRLECKIQSPKNVPHLMEMSALHPDNFSSTALALSPRELQSG